MVKLMDMAFTLWKMGENMKESLLIFWSMDQENKSSLMAIYMKEIM